MSLIKLGFMEGKKLFSQREIYIALFLCTVLFVMGLDAIGEPDVPLLFWRKLADVIPYVGFWFIAILIVVGVARCLPFEQEQGMSELLLTYKKGRLTLLVVKQIVILMYCVSIVLYFYGIAVFVFTMDYDLTGLFAQVKENPNLYFYANLEWTYAELMIYEFGYIVLASYIFALFIVLLSLFIKRSVFIMMIGGSIFAAGELFDKFIIKYIGTMELGYYLTTIYDYMFNGMLSFRYLNYFGPFSTNEVYGLFLFIAFLLFGMNLFLGRWQRHVAMGD